MLKRNNDLITNRGLIPALINCSSPQIAADFADFIADIIAQGGVLPPNHPFEIHPYLNEFPLQNYEKYIIGTFPPISYLKDHPNPLAPLLAVLNYPGGGGISAPWIPFYHGNRGNQWEYLLNPVEYAALVAIVPGLINPPVNRVDAKNYLIKFLITNKINYSDIIRSCQRAVYNANDIGLHNICINKDIICHILNNDNANEILFNTGSSFGVTGLQIHQNINPYGAPGMVNVRRTSSFDLFVRGCQEIGLKVEVRIIHGPGINFPWTPINLAAPHLHNKVIFEMRLSGNINIDDCNFNGVREYTVITGPSPSRQAERGVAGNANFIAWNALQPPGAGGVRNFIKYIYQTFRGNVAPLYNLNI